MKIAYVAHKYGGDPKNLDRADRWVSWLFRTHFPTYGFVAPWISVCRSIPETPENREMGLAFDCQLVAQADEIWLVGGTISDGMRREAACAKVVVDLTHLGDEPPAV